jgi:hypothetical protein
MPDPIVAAPVAAGEPNAGQATGQPITAGWRDSLPEEHRGAETLKKFEGKDWGEVGPKLAVSYINLEKMPRGVNVPKDGAPQTEWDAFYEKIGRPKTADEYGIKATVPDGMPWNEKAEKLILAKAHARGLTKPQAEGLLNDFIALSAEGQQQVKQAAAVEAEDAYATMQTEWGGLTERNTALVQRCVTEFGGAEFKQYLDETGLGNDPRLMRFVHKMGSGMVEGNLIRGEALGMKSADAKAEIDRLMRTPEWAKGDKATLAKIQDLYPVAHAA